MLGFSFKLLQKTKSPHCSYFSNILRSITEFEKADDSSLGTGTVKSQDKNFGSIGITDSEVEKEFKKRANSD